MTQQLMFAADTADIRAAMEAVTARQPLLFTRTGLFDTNTFERQAYAELQNVGVAASGDANFEPSYLVTEPDTIIVVRSVPQRRGGTKYAIDQAANRDSVLIQFGGRNSADVIILGRIGTISDTARSKALYNLFAKEIRGRFTKVGMFYVGPDAMAAMRAGQRVTDNVRRSAEYDLRLT
ncbi:MAG TPA: hypothetical protein VF824_13255 [Thermoanaerobaculia bacterium]|jgi:hypothetical protein